MKSLSVVQMTVGLSAVLHATALWLGTVYKAPQAMRSASRPQPIAVQIRAQPSGTVSQTSGTKTATDSKKRSPQRPAIQPQIKPISQPKPKPQTRSRALQPDPIAAATPPPEVPKPVRRRIVGLSLSSTVTPDTADQSGFFAAGNTRMGSTGNTAADPAAVQSAAPVNRPAARPSAPGALWVLPKPLAKIVPKYPKLLRAQGVEADVVLNVTVSKQGVVLRARVVQPSAYPAFDSSALTAVRAARYAPATLDGRPVDYTFAMTVRFRLEEL